MIKVTAIFAALAALMAGGGGIPAQSSTNTTKPAGSFPAHWIDGRADDEPPIQVHAYDPNTYILRQSLLTNREAPFLYLLFGSDRALLIDTGAGRCPVAETVMNTVAEWKRVHNKKEMALVVAHSHAHGDHTAGDADFNKIEGVRVVGRKPAEVAEFFQIKNWPEEIVQFDLGGRILFIIPIPGHEKSSIAVYDAQTGLLLSGDTLYPGRLYVEDAAAYRKSIDRISKFIESRPSTWILGAHIEMTTTPGRDFAFTVTRRENERILQLEQRHLIQLRDELGKMGETLERKALDDFIIFPVTPRKN